MSAAEELRGLLARVEAATGGDGALDEDCARAVSNAQRFAQLADAPPGTGCMMYDYGQEGRQQSALRVTSSLDAALGLLGKALPGWKWVAHSPRSGLKWGASVSNPRQGGAVVTAEHPVAAHFAMLAAILKGLIAQKEAA